MDTALLTEATAGPRPGDHDPIRVLFYREKFPTVTGLPRLRQLLGLLSLGHDVTVYAFGKDAGVDAYITENNLEGRIRYLRSPRSRAELYRGAALGLLKCGLARPATLTPVWEYGRSTKRFEVFRMLANLPRAPRGDKRFDIVHCHFGSDAVMGRLLKRWTGARLVISLNGIDLFESPVRGQGVEDAFRPLFNDADCVIANSEFTRERIEALGCPPARVVTVRAGLDLEKFRYVERPLPHSRPVRLLTVARLSSEKGIDIALAALARLKDKCDIRYRIIGGGPEEARLKALAEELGLSGLVEFAGVKSNDEVREAMEEADIFLLPSVTHGSGLQETAGQVVLEAHATGLPVIASDIGGIPESVLPGESALLTPERDPDALADALERLLERPEKWREMGAAGRRHVEEYFDQRRNAGRLVSIYREVMADAPLAAFG